MRELTAAESRFVSGGGDGCPAESSGSSYGGVTDSGVIAPDLGDIYKELVEATSNAIELIANAF